MKPKLTKGKGWRKESMRHSLAAKGVKTGHNIGKLGNAKLWAAGKLASTSKRLKEAKRIRAIKKSAMGRREEKERVKEMGLPPLPTGKESTRKRESMLRLRKEAIQEIKLGLRPVPEPMKREMKARQDEAMKERMKEIRKIRRSEQLKKIGRGLYIKGGLSRAEAMAQSLPTDEEMESKVPEKYKPIF